MAPMATTVPVRSSYRAVRWAAVRPQRRLGRRRRASHDHERLVGVAPPAARRAAPSVVDRLGRPGVAGGEDAPVHRGQVGREQHLGPGDLLDLGRVAVVEQAVGGEVLVDRAERACSPWAAARHRTRRGGVDDDAGRLDQPGPHERGQGQRRGGHVAAGGGDRGGPGELGPEQLGQAVGRTRRAARGGRAPRRTTAGTARRPSAGSRRPGRRRSRPGRAGRARAPATPRGAGRGRRGRARRPAGVVAARRPGRVGRGQAGIQLGRRSPAWVSPVAHTTSRSGWPATAAAARPRCSPTPR